MPRSILCLLLAVGCAAAQTWPDEPGIPVALSRADNLQASEAFLSTLTAQRQAATLPPPVVAPRAEIQTVTEDLQSGKVSLPGARRALEAWGQTAFGRQVAIFAIDCARTPMEIPGPLAKLPSAVISFAAAHFRPRSMPADQCAVLVVAITSGEPVQQQKM